MFFRNCTTNLHDTTPNKIIAVPRLLFHLTLSSAYHLKQCTILGKHQVVFISDISVNWSPQQVLRNCCCLRLLKYYQFIKYHGQRSWYDGTMVHWYNGMIVRFYVGKMVRYYDGTSVHCYDATIVLRYNCTMVRWYSSTMVRCYVDTMVRWCVDTMVLWYKYTMTRWSNGKMVRW